MQYSVTEADWVNDLLFELLTRQLSQLGHREVILEESDCHLLMKNLNLQTSADCKNGDAERNSIFYHPIHFHFTRHSPLALILGDLPAESDGFGSPRKAHGTRYHLEKYVSLFL